MASGRPHSNLDLRLHGTPYTDYDREFRISGWQRQAQLGDGRVVCAGTIAKTSGLDAATRCSYYTTKNSIVIGIIGPKPIIEGLFPLAAGVPLIVSFWIVVRRYEAVEQREMPKRVRVLLWLLSVFVGLSAAAGVLMLRVQGII
jgi:membrane protein insertase Oxa1/YidC/SpoIIIJ